MSQAEALRVIQALRERYENYHGVKYSDEALSSAVGSASRYISDHHLPGSAIELLDSAGARVKIRANTLPADILEVQKKIKIILHRMENAIASHEFEKARFYSNEERKERANLESLREKYHPGDLAAGTVGRDDIEAVVSQWTGMSVASMREADSGGGAGPQEQK
jgi:ATP-dependent Clp protease ATP-binding subunit ClpC